MSIFTIDLNMIRGEWSPFADSEPCNGLARGGDRQVGRVPRVNAVRWRAHTREAGAGPARVRATISSTTRVLASA